MLLEAFLPYPQASVTLTAGAAAVASALPAGETFEVQNMGTGACFIEIGPASVVAVAATGMPVLPGAFRRFRRPPGLTHISIIAPSGGGTVYITGGVGNTLRGRGRSGGTRSGGPSGPVAIFNAPLTSTLVPVAAGDPTFTFTRATTAYVQDCDGILRNAIAGEARFQGARRVRNCLVNSQDFSGAAWVKQNCTATFGVTGPTGQNDANTVTATAGGMQLYNFAILVPVGGAARMSWWIRRRTGTGTIQIRGADGGTQSDITAQVDGTWRRFATPVQIASPTAYTVLTLGTIGDQVDAAYVQCEAVDGQSNTAPGDYVSVGVLAAPYYGAGVDGVKYFGTTNGNSVAANVVTEAAGVAIPAATLLGYVAENQATNLCLNSQTFTTSWSTTGGTVTADTQTAPDGSLTADVFTDDATNGLHRIFGGGAAAITSGQPHTFSVYAKRGTLTWLQLFSDGAGNFYANFNLATGAVGSKHASVTAQITALSNGWYRCAMTFTAASASLNNQIYSLNADTASAGPSYVGSGQTMYLWGAQVEAASDSTTYIPTTTASVTRNVDSLSYAAATNVVAATGTAAIECVTGISTAASTRGLIALDIASYPLALTGALNPTIYDGSSSQATAAGATKLVPFKAASRWGAVGAQMGIVLNGGAIANLAFDGAMGGSNILIGNWNGTSTPSGPVKNVKIYATALTDAQLIAATA